MILDTLRNQPEVGMASSLFTALGSWMEVLNPILSFISLCIGIAVGVTTLILQLNKMRK